MRQRGFTLIELVIAVAVVALLLAIAYPSYIDNVRSSRRKSCEGVLMVAASAMEHQYAATSTYPLALPANVPTTCPPEGGGTVFYNVALTGATAATFTIQATPQGDQTKDSCGTLSLNERGQKGPTTAGCW